MLKHKVEVRIDRTKLDKHIKERNLNCHAFAHQLDMDAAHLHKFLKQNIGEGKLLWGKLYYYCKTYNYNFESFLKFEVVKYEKSN